MKNAEELALLPSSEAIGRAVKASRAKLGIRSQKTFARTMGMGWSQATVSNIERGIRTLTSAELRRLLRLIEVEREWSLDRASTWFWDLVDEEDRLAGRLVSADSPPAKGGLLIAA